MIFSLDSVALLSVFFFNDTPPTEIYTLSLHDALPISPRASPRPGVIRSCRCLRGRCSVRSEEHTSELQSLRHLVCRLLLEKKKRTTAEQAQLERQTRALRPRHRLHQLTDTHVATLLVA